MGKFYPKQSGTTEQSFEIGAGHNKAGLTIDVTALASDQTWKIPSTGGSFGDNLTTDGLGNLTWAPAGAAGDSTVPTYISPTQTYRVNADRQALFAQDIVVDGDLIVDGALIDVTDRVNGTVTDNSILRKQAGIITGDANLTMNVDPTLGPWLNAFESTSLNFTASFGGRGRSLNDNVNARALLVQGTDDFVNIQTPPGVNLPAKNNLAFAVGNHISTTGTAQAGVLNLKSGDAYAADDATQASGGGMTILAGAAIANNTTATTQGGGIDLRAGTAVANNTVGSGGYTIVSGGAANDFTNSVFVEAGVVTTYGGYVSPDDDQGGRVEIRGGAGSFRPLGRGGDVYLSAGTGTTPGQVIVNQTGLVISNPGYGISIAEGTDAKMGTATLASGTVTVANTSVTGQSRIFLTIQSANGGTVGQIYIDGIVPGVGFTIKSTSILDTSIVAYQIIQAV